MTEHTKISGYRNICEKCGKIINAFNRRELEYNFKAHQLSHNLTTPKRLKENFLDVTRKRILLKRGHKIRAIEGRKPISDERLMIDTLRLSVEKKERKIKRMLCKRAI